MTQRLIVLMLLLAIGPGAGAATAQAPAVDPAGGRGQAPVGTVGGAGRGALTPVVIGPRAPVPPEVAIPRPTPAELEQVNLTLKRFIEGDP